MANTIQIKRSTTNDAPATDLAAGELAFSEQAKKLYVGTATQGNFLIGGQVGVNVQAYDSNLVSDANYVATDVNFSTALNTKLANIEANATADQTQADINALNVNAATVSGFSVGVAVPANALFTDTTYTVGDGGLSQKNFTTTLASKLDGIAASANNYALPVATDLVSGGVKVGSNLTIDGSGVLSADAQAYTLPAATTGALGGVQVGSGLAITVGGLLSATGSTVGVATTTADGLMSSGDKTNHDSVYSWYSTMTTADGDAIINTVNEIVAAFENHAEGLNLITELDSKLSASSTIDGGSY
jgi:hypothetical protein